MSNWARSGFHVVTRVLRLKGKWKPHNQFSPFRLSADMTTVLLKEKYHETNTNLNELRFLFVNWFELLNMRWSSDPRQMWNFLSEKQNKKKNYQWCDFCPFFTPLPASVIDSCHNYIKLNKQPLPFSLADQLVFLPGIFQDVKISQNETVQAVASRIPGDVAFVTLQFHTQYHNATLSYNRVSYTTGVSI